MLQELKSIAIRQSFQPGFLAIFINPFFFIRRGLFINIRENAKKLEGVLLDFGCGRKPYKNLFAVKEYIGVDIEQSGHSHALSEVDVYYDGKTIPFPAGYFDSVFCSEVLEHVFEVDTILTELNRVLKANGRILLTVPFVWNDHEVPYDYGRYSTYGLEYLLSKHGFKIEKITKSTNFIETIFQLMMLYVYEVTKTKNRILTAILNVIFISPITLVGLIAGKILPTRNDFYHNSIVLAYKKTENSTE